MDWVDFDKLRFWRSLESATQSRNISAEALRQFERDDLMGIVQLLARDFDNVTVPGLIAKIPSMRIYTGYSSALGYEIGLYVNRISPNGVHVVHFVLGE